MNGAKRVALTYGNDAEKAVSLYLQTQGYRILAHNYRVRGGEVDIIAAHSNQIFFVEVKARVTPSDDVLCALVPESKQRKIVLAARHFIATHMPQTEVLYRFDVAFVAGVADAAAVTYLEDAFHALEEW